MIKNILEMLALSNFYGESESIDLVKGKNEIPKTIKEAYKQGLRKLKAMDNGRN